MHPQLRKKLRAFSSAGSEHLPYKQRVGGSNPSTPTEGSYFSCRMLFGRLAQLVQSICLTSRGSAVRIRQRPQPKSIDQISLFGRLAQLVQSICLTSRGSAVRIRQAEGRRFESVNAHVEFRQDAEFFVFIHFFFCMPEFCRRCICAAFGNFRKTSDSFLLFIGFFGWEC